MFPIKFYFIFYCRIYLFIVQLFHQTSTKPGITEWDASFELNPSRCEYLLGILTTPIHSSIRSFMQNSWINDLPKNVCYALLYDKPGYIPVQEKFDNISMFVIPFYSPIISCNFHQTWDN